jgi:hypothetical protein
VFACVTSLAASLLYLAPVLLMVAFVVVAKIRGRGADPDYEGPEASSTARMLPAGSRNQAIGGP